MGKAIYRARKLAVIAAMREVMQMMIPQWQAYDKVEALVQSVRLAKTLLKAVAAEGELFAGCFMIGMLVEKLDHVTQTRWCHYQ